METTFLLTTSSQEDRSLVLDMVKTIPNVITILNVEDSHDGTEFYALMRIRSEFPAVIATGLIHASLAKGEVTFKSAADGIDLEAPFAGK